VSELLKEERGKDNSQPENSQMNRTV